MEEIPATPVHTALTVIRTATTGTLLAGPMQATVTPASAKAVIQLAPNPIRARTRATTAEATNAPTVPAAST